MDYQSRQINDIYLLKAVSLEEIFESNEIDEILKEPYFWNLDSEEENSLDDKMPQKPISRFKKHNMNFDRGTLVMKLLTIAIDKLKQVNKVVAKGLGWVKTEIQDKLVCKDTPSLVKSNGGHLNNIEYKNIMSWIDENSTSNNLEELDSKRKTFSPFTIKGLPKTTTSIVEQEEKYKHRNSLYTFDSIKLNLRKTSYKNNLTKHLEDQIEKVENKEEINAIKGLPKFNNSLTYINKDETINDFFESTAEIKKSKLKLRKLNTMNSIPEVIQPTKQKMKKNILNLENVLMVDEELSISVNNKNFDIFYFENNVGRANVLPFIAYEVFFNYDLYCIIQINAMEKFTEIVRDGYLKNNPYHNDIHAADVLQTCHSMIYFSDLIDVMMFDYLDLSGFFIAAIIHDYKHPGVTNGFLINTKDTLAIKYNGKSIRIINN